MNNNLTTVELPSRGLLYDESIGSTVTLKSIEIKEDKMIFGSTTTDGVTRALQSCIVEPKGLKLSDLLPADQYFLLIQLRIHTYGSDYPVAVACTNPECTTNGEKQDLVVDLDQLDVYKLPEDFDEDIDTGALPASGDTLSLRLLYNKDYEAVAKQAKKLAKKLKLPYGEVEYGMRLAKHITAINGEEVDFHQAQQYVDSMHGKDIAYVWHVLDEVQLGYDTNVTLECKDCGEDIEFVLPMNSEFFRPKFR